MSRFNSILVANRGEIALRVIKTARKLGYRTVAVYSEADAGSPHVRLADDAVCVGPAPVGESYLVAGNILEAARKSGAQAIHPGYGFLSENAAFSKACEENGLVFIGPTPDAIDLMGNKAAAKRRMIEAGVPCVPGYQGQDQSDAVLIAEAEKIGFPLMVKAAAGGGGRGMRLVHAAGDLATAISSARSEALNAFGSDELILEKAIVRPRHVELQVFADEFGNALYLGERDCSVQRRHQKVIEEAPCPVMTADLRDRMGKAAVDAATSINYRGAGTVEFMLDTSGEFYFLEMNTRLQVEHPVTEMITGLDLVEMQIRVAQGEALELEQSDVSLNGHAIEARLYAEDPAQGFLPVTGHIDLWQPAEGEGVRVDAGIETGLDISPYYDPMIAKVIAWGSNRETARNRLIDALNRTRLFGTKTNKRFLVDILEKQTFADGAATTAFIAEEFADGDIAAAELSPREAVIAAVLLYEAERTAANAASLGVNPELLNWGSSGRLVTPYSFSSDARRVDVEVSTNALGQYDARCDGETFAVLVLDIGKSEARLAINDRRFEIGYHSPAAGHIHFELDGRAHSVRNEFAFSRTENDEVGGGRVTAPMHGTLLEIVVAQGARVEKGDRLAVLEAMKMQHELLAEISGSVAEIHARAGTQIAADDVILIIQPDEK